jgi:hypothetical protein
MAKFNRADTRAAVSSPLATQATPTGRTYEGAPGYNRTDKAALFLLGVNNMVGEKTFYETSDDRDERFRDLVRRNALADPLWTYEYLRWLRASANMRSASLVGAAEFVRARLQASDKTDVRAPDNTARGIDRAVIDAVILRADEPGEMLGYWMSRYGRAIPKPIKRGVADAVRRLYTERTMIKWDGGDSAYRFGDVVDLVHPFPADSKPYQGALFQHLLDRRHGHADEVAEQLATIRLNREFYRRVAAGETGLLLDNTAISQAGLTWENALSLAGNHPSVNRARLWEAMIPSMGIMALTRNLRNFDQAGIGEDAIDKVVARLSDPDEIAASRMFPYRFFSAHQATPSVNWSRALNRALTHSIRNIPELPGRTLILSDTSGSMTNPVSDKSTVKMLEVAALFATAMARRNVGKVDLYGFASGTFHHPLGSGGSLLPELESFVHRSGSVGHGTEIARAMRETFRGHDRVVLFTDEQTFGGSSWRGHHGDVKNAVPADVPVYVFNLGGYRFGMMPSGGTASETPNRHEFAGGFTDAGFQMIQMLEAGKNGNWPWVA